MDQFSKDEKIRYARQTILPMIGEAGQAKLKKARILMIGAGGLGSSPAYYLAAAGVGTIGIADDDKVSLSNLHRQILHYTSDLDKPKVISAQDRQSSLPLSHQRPVLLCQKTFHLRRSPSVRRTGEHLRTHRAVLPLYLPRASAAGRNAVVRRSGRHRCCAGYFGIDAGQ